MSSARALKSLDLAGIAEYIKSGACKKVAVLTGAGVSTGAGIPDFRSPGGMYSTLRPELITATEEQRSWMRMDPTMVVTREMFFMNQFPYMEVRRPFILGTRDHKWKATVSHWFMKFLDDDGLLNRLFTQNIDGLDYQTGIRPDHVTNVHGSIAQIRCEGCRYEMPLDRFCEEVRIHIKDIYGIDETAPKESSNIKCPSCNKALLKPATVLFGSALPREFFDYCPDLEDVDLLIVTGSSLQVSPANGVVRMVAKDCPRLIVNKDPVGAELGIRYGAGNTRDVFVAGECDEVFLDLIMLLGWQERIAAVQDRLPEANQALLKAAL